MRFVVNYNIAVMRQEFSHGRGIMPDFTKKAIIASFLKLLAQKPLNKITVKDIVLDCGINRNSFYYHFADLPTLIEDVLKADADSIVEKTASIGSLEECLSVAIDFALENKQAVLHLYNSTSREQYERYLNNIMKYAVTEYIDRMCEGRGVIEEDKQIVILAYTYELIGLTLNWMGAEMSYDVVSKVKRFSHLFSGSVERAFEISARENGGV